MIPLFIALALMLGAGGTVAMSDSARPGDLLFPIDRAVEEIRANFATDEGKVELKIKFSEERLDELESILDESATSTQSGVSEEAEANLSQALDILTSHLMDIHGLASTTPGIAQAISVIEARLQSNTGALPQELKIKIRDDRGRIELKTEEGKIKVKIDSEGEVEVEVENEDENEDEDGDDREKKEDSDSGHRSSATSTRSDDDDDDSDNSGFEAEADVFTDITVVKVEIQDEKTTFTTDANTRATIVAEIVSRYPTLVAADVDAALKLEIEDRVSRPDDSEKDKDDADDSSGSSDDDNDSDDDADDDNSGSSDEDDDSDDSDDDDNSGSGGNSGSSNN